MRNSMVIGIVNVALVVLLGGCAGETTIAPPLPQGTVTLQAPLADGSAYFFADADFRGDVVRVDSVESLPAGVPHDLGNRKGVSSMQWNLPPGALMVAYEEPGARGSQIALWGKGQADRMEHWRLNDRITQWAWYNLQAGPNALPRPLGAQPTAALPTGIIEMYRDHDFMGTLTSIGPVAQFPATVLNKAGAANDGMTSLRWNLPAGVVVVLYEDASGMGRQLTLFGSGQYSSVTPWKFNDKVSRWAWYDVAGAR